MSIPKTILLATDLSDTSRPALDYALGLRDAYDAWLYVLAVAPEPVHATWAGFTPGEVLLKTAEHFREKAWSRLQAWVPPEAMASGRVRLRATWGDVTDEVLKHADGHQVDLIICGTHGRDGWDHAIAGSIAEQIVRLAPCPVMTVRGAPSPVIAAAVSQTAGANNVDG